MLGLPDGIKACLFDLDGVLTKTAVVHAAAWKKTFNSFLRQRSTAAGVFEAFSPQDYSRFVDGKPRAAGVRDFLASRGIELDEGAPDDAPGTATVYGIGNKKNELLLQVMKRDGVQVYEGSLRYI